MTLLSGHDVFGQLVYKNLSTEFETIDRVERTFNTTLQVHVKMNSEIDLNLNKKHDHNYPKTLLIPQIKSTSQYVFAKYSALEIYNLKRPEIEVIVKSELMKLLKTYGIEVTQFFMHFDLPDKLHAELEEEYKKLYDNAFKTCTAKTFARIKRIDSIGSSKNLIQYEFFVDDKSFIGFPSADSIEGTINIGDSLRVQYACENPNFHKVLKN